MPFARPPLADLVPRIRGDLRGRLELGGPLLGRAMVDVLGAVWAGAVHLLYGYLDWAVRQLFGDDDDDDVLLKKASLYGITPIAATFATGNVTITGSTGTVLAGEVIQLDADTLYTVTTGAALSGGTGTIVVTAALAGAAANLPVGATLSFQTSIAGVNPTATATTGGPQGDGIAGGFDQESVASVRARYLLRLREPPQGGANQDYIEWALAAPGGGATRAWVFPNELGLGTVVTRFVNDNAGSIFPTSGQVTAVQAYINAQRPITAVPAAVAPTALAVAFTIHLVPDTGATRAAVTAQLTDLFARLGRPGDGAGLGTIPLSQIRTAVGIADGVTDYTLTAPPADVVPGVGQLPVVGVISWT